MTDVRDICFTFTVGYQEGYFHIIVTKRQQALLNLVKVLGGILHRDLTPDTDLCHMPGLEWRGNATTVNDYSNHLAATHVYNRCLTREKSRAVPLMKILLIQSLSLIKA